MAYNKFIKKDGTVMLDLTDTTVSVETLAKDITAVDKYGNKIVGTLTDSPLPIEVSTEEAMNELLTNGELNGVYKYTGTSGTYENGALYEITEESDALKGTWRFTIDNTYHNYMEFPFGTYNLSYGVKYIGNLSQPDTYYISTDTYRQFIISEAGASFHMCGNDISLVNSNNEVINLNDYDDLIIGFNRTARGTKPHITGIIQAMYGINYVDLDIYSSLSEVENGDTLLALLQANATKQPSKTFEKLVIPTGTLEITTNGDYNVSAYANTKVNVEDSPIPIEVSTEEEMNELLTNGELNGVYKYIGDSGTYEKYALYILKNTSTFASSDGYYITDADGTILVPKGDIEIVKLSDQEDLTKYLTKYFEEEYETVDLPYVTRLKNYAFYNNETLNYINIPLLISIGHYAFHGCKNLALTELPSGITYIGESAFYGCKNLALTKLPSGITHIRDDTFRGCSNLALTELPSGITYIGWGAFDYCYNLALTKLPSKITSIAYHAFRECSNLALTELPSGITSIGELAFDNCSNLALTELPSEITNIGSHAFRRCTNLALTKLPSGITNIRDSVFFKCSNLALTELPSGITNISDYAFYFCSNLALTELPSGITNIGEYAFTYCSNLALTKLPSGITNIYDSVFRGCSNLALTELPSGITSIGENAFDGCTSLTNLTFKSTVNNIASDAFANCSNLLTINVPWSEGEVENAPWGATNATINYNYTEE